MKRRKRGRPVGKIYVQTDLEAVAGVLNFEEWCVPEGVHYHHARELLTREINAAVEGFFAGGAREIVVADGHGPGGVNPSLIDSRVQLIRGWPNGWPLELDSTFDALAFVGQHAKAGTVGSHLAHTQSFNHVDMSVNGVSIGEFGQLVLCASELGVRTIFASGEEAFVREARALVPGIEAVSVKRGLRRGPAGDDLNERDYRRFNTAAIHLPPARSRALIKAGARRACRRAKREDFGLVPLSPPFERVVVLRADDRSPGKRISRKTHPSSVSALLNLPYDPTPM